MAGKNHKSIVFLCLIFSFLSCQSVPKAPNVNLESSAALPFEDGAFVYVFADAVRARSIIELLPINELNNKQVRQMLDRTRFFAAALFPQGSGLRFQIAAQGNYPGSQANAALSFDKSWKKRRSGTGGRYWYSSLNRLSIVLGSSYAYATAYAAAYTAASANNEPFEPFTPSPGVQIPEEFIEFHKESYGLLNSPLSCWIPNPSTLLNQMFAGLPVQSVKNLFFNLFPGMEGRYEAVIRLQFENPSHARGMAVILSLASGFSSSNPLLSIFLANPPVVTGNAVDICSALLSEEEIKVLLELLTVMN
jgi:hypothetical protein